MLTILTTTTTTSHKVDIDPDAGSEYESLLGEHRHRVVDDDEELIDRASSARCRPRTVVIGCLVIAVVIAAALALTDAGSLLARPVTLPSPPHVHVNHQRWATVLTRLSAGEPIVMGFVGGSITAGASYTYPSKVPALFERDFPVRDNKTGNHRADNRAAGGATSAVASLCASFGSEPLPDILFMEYAVNDAYYTDVRTLSGDSGVLAFTPQDNIERFARRFLVNGMAGGPALMLVVMADRNGHTAQESQLIAAAHYGIPVVSWRDQFLNDWRTRQQLYASKLEIKSVYRADDPLHPEEAAHQVVSELVVERIREMNRSLSASNGTSLYWSTTLSQQSERPSAQLVALSSSLPEPLNPNVLLTASPGHHCHLTFSAFQRRPDSDRTNVTMGGFYYHNLPGTSKPTYNAIDLNRADGSVTFKSPVPFRTAAMLLYIRSWNTSWANGSVSLSSTTNPACRTKPSAVYGVWSTPATQTSAAAVWQRTDADGACLYDTMTIQRKTTGDMRLLGYYAG